MHCAAVGTLAVAPSGFEQVLGDGPSPFEPPASRLRRRNLFVLSSGLFLAFTLFDSIVFGMSMLAHPLAGDAVERAIGTMSSELVFLLESTQVPRDIIAKLGELGYTDMDTFSNME